MIVPTNDITRFLLDNSIERDASSLFQNAGYRETNGGWLVIDEGHYLQDTDHLIEDCVANECFQMAALIKRYVEGKQKKP